MQIDSNFTGAFRFNFEITSDGWTYWYDSANVILADVDDGVTLPTTYSLTNNYPNPFNPSTKIRYSVPQSSNVVIKLFDILGNEIETLVDEEKPVGTYEVTWYTENLPSGIYFYRLQAVPTGRQAGSFVETKKMVLMK